MSDTLHSRLFGLILFQFKRLIIAALFVISADWLAHRLGIWPAIILMSLLALFFCASIAWLLHRAPPGRASLINHIAPIALPVGIHIGRGKLWPIIACSSATWIIFAAAGAFHAGSRFSLLPPSTSVPHVILIVSLILDGLGCIYLLNRWAKRITLGSPSLRPMLPLLSILLLAMAGGIALSRLGWPNSAALVAGLPPLIVGGFYASFMLFVLIARPRWN